MQTKGGLNGKRANGNDGEVEIASGMKTVRAGGSRKECELELVGGGVGVMMMGLRTVSVNVLCARHRHIPVAQGDHVLSNTFVRATLL